MSESFVEKNMAASMDFHAYVDKYPQLLKSIPNGAYIVFTINNDEQFNADSMSLIKDRRRKKIVEAHRTKLAWTIRPLQIV
jgi:hypothetical protein